jgi:hypothetical protein
MSAHDDGSIPSELDYEFACAVADFWPQSMALSINAYVITHPLINMQEWFENQVARRRSELALCLNLG